MSSSFQINIERLSNFAYDTLNPNISDSTDPRVPIPLDNTTGEVILSTIRLPVQKEKSFIWLSATVGFRVNGPDASNPPAAMIFRIYRGNPDTGNLIYTTTDSGQGGAGEPTFRTTNLNHVDTQKKTCSCVSYTLTVEAVDIESIDIIGPITFTAAEILDSN
ncbi:MAG TPA: hypothetical protein PLG49_07195 [Defluviitaleaceae bacterium]|nr:hypothetical protein [Defluviitaleaceae bacterium]